MRGTVLMLALLGAGGMAWADDAEPVLSVASLHARQLVPGEFAMVNGYVVKNYTCPPCPEGAECKPCMEDNIILSDRNAPRTTYTDLAEDEVVLFLNNADLYLVGRRYHCQVSPNKERRLGAPIGNTLGALWCAEQATCDEALAATGRSTPFTVQDFNQTEVRSWDLACLAGYVVASYPSPPCPPNAACEAVAEHVIIADDNVPFTGASSAPLAPHQRLLQANNVSRLAIGQRYRWAVKINGVHHTGTTPHVGFCADASVLSVEPEASP